MLKRLSFILAIVLCSVSLVQAANMKVNPEAKSFKYSTTVEKEKPKLNDVTKNLIAAYRNNPSLENENALRKQIGINYDKVVAKKKAKLEELKKTAKDQSKIDEMQEIVDEMLRDREDRINQSFERFTDSRLKPNAHNTTDGYMPVLGVGENIYIAYTPVTNEEYAIFLDETGRKSPQNWTNNNISENQKKYPVIYVSYNDAVAYCKWLTKKNGNYVYRLPTEKEWEYAAGHMPKDADFNSGEDRKLTPVTKYSQTISASGAIDMWGNVWEWTSTAREQKQKAVKGGAYDSPRTSCRTENRNESREQNTSYANVGFRVICEK